MSWYGRTAVANETADWLVGEGHLREGFTYGQLFAAAYQTLGEAHRSEYLFKNTILRRLVFGKYSPATTSFYVELPVGDARADAVLVNGQATVFEIKTSHDDLSRAASQIAEYGRCFRYVTFVVDPQLAERAGRLLPSHIGLYVLSGRSLRPQRPALEHSQMLCSSAIFRLLHDRECQDILARYGVDASSVAPIDRHDYFATEFCRLSPSDAHHHLEVALRRRAPASRAASVCARLPTCLHAAVFWYRVRKRDWNSLAELMDQRFCVIEAHSSTGE